MLSERGRRLVGIERRFARSQHNLQELKELVGDHAEANPIAFLIEPQGDPHGIEWAVRVEAFNAPNYIDIGVRIGEIFHLYRSILDNLVWHLAIKNTGKDPPTDRPASVAFPIIDLKENWKRHGKPKISLLADEPKAIIRKAQPFCARHAPNPEPLGLLGALNNMDKHRVILPMTLLPDAFEKVGKITISEDVVVTPIVTGEPVEKDATVYILRLSRPADVKVKFHDTFDIVLDLSGFKNVGVHSRYPYKSVLNEVRDEVVRLVDKLKPYV